MRKIPTGWHRGRAHGLGVVRSAGVLYEAVEPGSEQHLLQAVVEDVARRARHLGPHHHQVALMIPLSPNCHSRTPARSLGNTESGRADFVNGLFSSSAIRCEIDAIACPQWAVSLSSAPFRVKLGRGP